MGKIVVIGGGEIKDLETLVFDRRICELTGKKHPKALFIPTASSEPAEYIETFNKIYGKKLGCKTDVLYLIKEKPSQKEIKEKIFGSDLIYVGGGNTLKMMNKWRQTGVDKYLKQAYKQGIVLSGVSAGGICWFDYGRSDSRKFYNPDADYIRVSGLGLIKGIHFPHGKKKRYKDFAKFMQKYREMGIAVDNECAIEFIDDTYKVFSAKRTANAYRIFRQKNRVHIEKIEKEKEYMPVSELYVL